MGVPMRDGSGAPPPGLIRRKSVSVSERGLVSAARLLPEWPIPLLVRPTVGGVNLIEWAEQNRDYIAGLLLEHRALLFRGFAMESAADCERFALATSYGQLLRYRDSSTPRDS